MGIMLVGFYETITELSLISIVSGFWMKKSIQTLWVNIDVFFIAFLLPYK